MNNTFYLEVVCLLKNIRIKECYFFSNIILFVTKKSNTSLALSLKSKIMSKTEEISIYQI